MRFAQSPCRTTPSPAIQPASWNVLLLCSDLLVLTECLDRLSSGRSRSLAAAVKDAERVRKALAPPP